MNTKENLIKSVRVIGLKQNGQGAFYKADKSYTEIKGYDEKGRLKHYENSDGEKETFKYSEDGSVLKYKYTKE